MFRLVKFSNGRYGLQNTLTNVILSKTFLTKRGANRHVTKFFRKLHKLNAKLDRQQNDVTFVK